MKNKQTLHVAIAESSVIIRGGLSSALKQLPNINMQIVELATPQSLKVCIDTQSLDILFINPHFDAYFDIALFKEKYKEKQIHVVALLSSFIDNNIVNKYDETISIYDDLNQLSNTIDKLKKILPDEELDDSLSDREKEVLICIVRGMTNKEIADFLIISIHTVITHRKNITSKLQIHSVSGLTIYAIVNKLISLDELENFE
ncbi:MAG: LuxR C-terminal-related transcriptional regulator [Bacteroides sp.]|nr:LuxR C-terminal-related transcriptional regulator [Bacteroides sp.]